MKKKRAVLQVFVLLQALDLAITLVVIETAGISYELNPLARLIFIQTSVIGGAIAIKLVAIVGGAFLYWVNCFKVLLCLTIYYVVAIAVGIAVNLPV